MKRKKYYPYLTLGFFLLILFHFPKNWVNSLRYVACSLPSFFLTKTTTTPCTSEENIEMLLLKKQNENLRKRLLSEERIDYKIKKLEKIDVLKEKNKELKAFYTRRKNALLKQLDMDLLFLYAQVTFRDPSSWSSSIWINVGSKNNLDLGKTIVNINSPVLKGQNLIGVVDYVGKSKSRVRLITDSNVVPSVRVVRGGTADREASDLINVLVEKILLREQDQQIASVLEELKQLLKESNEEKYLAKGELLGTSASSWRGCSSTLKGGGFNYDFSDEEGPYLDLRSGKTLEKFKAKETLKIIKKGDLLFTTGMDGIFPADLPVAIVSDISPLKEGDVAFEIEAKMLSGSLSDIKNVIVLPPIFEEKEQANLN